MSSPAPISSSTASATSPLTSMRRDQRFLAPATPRPPASVSAVRISTALASNAGKMPASTLVSLAQSQIPVGAIRLDARVLAMTAALAAARLTPPPPP